MLTCFRNYDTVNAMKFKCGNCGGTLASDIRDSGTVSQCPHCLHGLIVPFPVVVAKAKKHLDKPVVRVNDRNFTSVPWSISVCRIAMLLQIVIGAAKFVLLSELSSMQSMDEAVILLVCLIVVLVEIGVIGVFIGICVRSQFCRWFYIITNILGLFIAIPIMLTAPTFMGLNGIFQTLISLLMTMCLLTPSASQWFAEKNS